MASQEASPITLHTPFPTGSWTLYFHSAEESKWTLQTFQSLGSMTTWSDFWNVMEGLRVDTLSEGMFFLMRDPSPPLWESHHHIRGGCYSFRCPKKDVCDVFLAYAIACILNKVTTSPEHRSNGISISPKRGFNIIKVWNTDAQQFHLPSQLQTHFSSIRESDIIYTPFVQKKM